MRSKPAVDDSGAGVVRRLLDIFDENVVAWVSGSDVVSVTGWARGAAIPELAERRLRMARRVLEVASSSEGVARAKVWCMGANRTLGGHSPFARLREGDDLAVLLAIQSFSGS